MSVVQYSVSEIGAESSDRIYTQVLLIGVPDRGARRAVVPLGFGKLVQFGQMGWEIRAFRGLNFSR